MQFLELIDAVKEVVKDSAFDAKIPGYVNAAFEEALLEAKLPEYKRCAAVQLSSTENFVTLTDEVEDFGSILKILSSATAYETLESMIEGESITAFGEIGAELKAIAIEGSVLWYYPAVSMSLPFMYLAKPADLEYNDDEIPLIPNSVQREIAVHGAAIPCFDVIEDSLEGEKVNKNYHQILFNQAKQKLKEWNGRRRSHISTSRWG